MERAKRWNDWNASKASRITGGQMDVNLDELFSGETVVTQLLKGYEVRVKFREIDAKTDIEFQRRNAKVNNRNGKIEQSIESLTADIWLFDELCTAVEVAVGDHVEAVPDFKSKLSTDFKRVALFNYRQRISKKDDGGN